MNEGWIRFWRKLLKSVIFDDEGLLKVWIWCLLKASFKEEWKTVRTGRGQTQVKLLPGQFIFQRHIAAQELKMNPATLWHRMQILKKLKNVSTQPSTHFSIGSVINWHIYQGDREELCQIFSTQQDTQEAPKVSNPAPDAVSEPSKKLRSKEKRSCGMLEALRAFLASTTEFSDLPEGTRNLVLSFVDKARASNKTTAISTRRVQTILTDLVAISGETSPECLDYALGVTVQKAEAGQFTFSKQNVTGYVKAVARSRYERDGKGEDRYEPVETDLDALYR